MQVFDYYDIRMLNYGNISILKEVNRLVINPVERDNKLEFRTHKKSHTLFAIPVRDIDKIEFVRQLEGIEITFYEKPLIGPQGQTHTILFRVNKYINSLQSLIQYLRDAEKDPIIQRKLKGDLNPTLCIECYKNEFVSIIKLQKLCKDCFAKLYGKRVLYTTAEYHGGHKAYLAGGVFARFESGRMALTESHLIFLKDDDYDPLKRIEIIIPLNSIVLESWTIQQETRRKEFSGGAVSYG
jgi:hypothetical protein